jgi:NifU-like protein involved in Fe-S cluster formation
VSAELDALYRDVILDHNRNPRHYRAIAGAQAGRATTRSAAIA